MRAAGALVPTRDGTEFSSLHRPTVTRHLRPELLSYMEAEGLVLLD